DWARERKLTSPPLISFETGRRTQTQSCWAVQEPAPANGSLVLFTNRNRGREANTRAEAAEKNLHLRSSRARRESLLPLDKDLSWKSAYRTSLTMSALSNPFWTDFSHPLRRVVFVALAGHWRPRLVCNLSVGFDPTQTSLRSNFDHDYFFKLPF